MADKKFSAISTLRPGTALMVPDTPGAARGMYPLDQRWLKDEEDDDSDGESWGLTRRSSVRAASDGAAARRWRRRMQRTGGVAVLPVAASEADAASDLLTESSAAATAAVLKCRNLARKANGGSGSGPSRKAGPRGWRAKAKRADASKAAEARRQQRLEAKVQRADEAKRAEAKRQEVKQQRERLREVKACLKELVRSVWKQDVEERSAANAARKKALAAKRRPKGYVSSATVGLGRDCCR